MNIFPSQPLHHNHHHEPVFNVPLVLIGVIALLLGIHAFISFMPDNEAYEFLFSWGFIPARLSVWFDPSLMNDVVSGVKKNIPGIEMAVPSQLNEMFPPDMVDARLWTLITYGLLHGGWAHVLLNLVWLLIFGAPIARRWGATKFLMISLISSVAGALLYAALHPFSVIPLIGASAAVSGLTGAAARFVFQPGAFGPSASSVVPAQSVSEILKNRQAAIFILFWFAANVVFGAYAADLGLSEDSIAWEAHLGGFLAGFFLFHLFEMKSR
jgi:membrane associated rhomboid family serine protease